MSRKYKDQSEVPNEVLITRLKELYLAISKSVDRRKMIEREFTMRIPAEVDRDANIVLNEAAIRLERLNHLEKYVIDQGIDLGTELTDYIEKFGSAKNALHCNCSLPFLIHQVFMMTDASTKGEIVEALTGVCWDNDESDRVIEAVMAGEEGN